MMSAFWVFLIVCVKPINAATPEAVWPDVPELHDALPTQCSKHLALTPGKPVPAALLDAEGNVACGAVAVPTSYYADLLDTDIAYGHLRVWAKLELTKRDVLLEASQREAEWWKVKAATPVPFHHRPWFNQGLGAAAVLTGAVAVSLASDVEIPK